MQICGNIHGYFILDIDIGCLGWKLWKFAKKLGHLNES